MLSSYAVDLSVEVKRSKSVPKVCLVRREAYLLTYILPARDTGIP